MSKIDKKGEAAFYVLVFLAVLIISFLYWKIILIIVVIVALGFFLFHGKASGNQYDPVRYEFKSYQQTDFEKPKPKCEQHYSNYKKSSYREKKQKGDLYEAIVADHFRSLDYDVVEHGRIKGKKDQGIDLIATRNDRILLIQCKDWDVNTRFKIRHSHLKEFVGNTYVFLEKNPILSKMGSIKRVFVTSGNILDDSAVGYLKHNPDIIEHKVIPSREA